MYGRIVQSSKGRLVPGPHQEPIQEQAHKLLAVQWVFLQSRAPVRWPDSLQDASIENDTDVLQCSIVMTFYVCTTVLHTAEQAHRFSSYNSFFYNALHLSFGQVLNNVPA